MLTQGEKFSHYNIISSLGAGGMGEVYLAEDTKLERQVALKVLLDDVADDEDRVRRFVQEAKASSALNHPNILTVYEIGEFKASRYIATEFIKGKTLRDAMRAEPFKLGESLEILLQVAAALGAAHEAGIIHRDIKPENIMIRDDGLVKVLDFGLAKLSAMAAENQVKTLPQLNTEPGKLMGTVAYMSPEQARGRKLDPRSDIFSLGIVMFELFTGRRPFDGEGHFDLISSILKDEPPQLRQVSPDMPRQLERIVDKSLRKDRDHRYQHVKDLYIDIEDLRDELKLEQSQSRILETRGTAAPMATNPGEAISTLTASISKTRRFTLLHAIIFALVAAGIVGAVWYFRPPPLAATAPGSYKATEVATWNSAAGELASSASFSPDGNLIAFASTRSGSRDIWVTQTASNEPIQVTNDEFSNINPIWSPKGEEIAYFSDRSGGTGTGTSSVGIWRISALGGTPRFVGSISDPGGCELRRWAASGKIYYQMRKELYAMDLSSGASQKVTAVDQPDVWWINISGDERSVAYSTRSDGAWQILVGDNTGGNTVGAAGGQGTIDGITWLPERKRIFYSAAVDGIVQVFVADEGTRQGSRITTSETDNSIADASPDGKSIIVSSAKEESNLWQVSTANGHESSLPRDLSARLWPSVSPDNEKIAFQSVKNLSGGNKLFECDIVVRTLKPRDENERSTLLAERGLFPAWSPDGSSLAFMRKDAESLDLYSINPNGGGEKRLTTGGIPLMGYSISPYNYTQATAFAWSPDSSRIAYVSERNGAANIWAVGSGDGSDEPLTDNIDTDVTFYSPMWSSDGKRLAFSFEKKSRDANGKLIRGLKLIDTAAGTSVIFESPKSFRLIGWTADEAGLIIAEPDKKSGLPPETVLKRVTIAVGAVSVVADLKNVYFYNIFLSDDRKFIAYADRSDNTDDIWIIPSSGAAAARKVTKNNDSGLYFSRLAWLHDGSSIVFGKQTRYSLLSIITDIN